MSANLNHIEAPGIEDHNRGGMNTHPQNISEERASMRCINSCNICCNFHSRMGCTINNGYRHVPKPPAPTKVVKHPEEKLVGRYKIKKGSR